MTRTLSQSRPIHEKYRGLAITDMNSYLECRENIRRDFYPEHFLTLKRYYRRAFLNAPFRRRTQHG